MTQPRTRVALITGASSGIGRVSALALAEAGLLTYATARRPESVAELQARGLRTLALDVTDEASMRAALRAVEAEHGGIDVLVNNAGYASMGALEEVELAEWRRQFETNVFGLVRLCQLVLPGMRARGAGRIINVSSMGGEMVIPFGAAYHASKYAVEALSDALRFEAQPFGVQVSVVQPGPVRTALAERGRETLQPRPGSPYAQALEGMGRQLNRSYEQGQGLLEPEAVARVIVAAATSPRPRTRYKVGAMAYLLPGMRHILTDRLWDALLRRVSAADAPASSPRTTS